MCKTTWLQRWDFDIGHKNLKDNQENIVFKNEQITYLAEHIDSEVEIEVLEIDFVENVVVVVDTDWHLLDDGRQLFKISNLNRYPFFF